MKYWSQIRLQSVHLSFHILLKMYAPTTLPYFPLLEFICREAFTHTTPYVWNIPLTNLTFARIIFIHLCLNVIPSGKSSFTI